MESEGTATVEVAQPAAEGLSTPAQEPAAAGNPAGASAPATLDLEQYGDQLVPITVQGQQRQVSLREAVSGYMMQQDYTQKTQALAQAQRLWEALETDPVTVAKALYDAYADEIGTTAPPAEPAASLDPEEQRLAEFERFMQEQRSRDIDAQIDATLANIKTSYGDKFSYTDEELVQYAVDHNQFDLEQAFRGLAFDKLLQIEQSAPQLAAEQRAALDLQAQQAKASAPPVAGGHGVQAGVVTPGSAERPETFEDAYALAKRQLGRS